MKVRYLSVADWGGKWARPPVKEKLPDRELFVHQVGAASAPWMDSKSAEQTFRDLNAYAIGTKGYSFLDYDALVHYHRGDDVLTIAEGRGPWLSAATRDRNEEGEAIVVCGNYDLRAPHPAELEGVALAIVWAAKQGWITADATILGHRDNPRHPGATSCPGTHMYAQLPAIRRRVGELRQAPEPTPAPEPGEERLLVAHGWYRLRPGEWPWSVAARVLGAGQRHPEVTAINRPVDEWEPGSFVAIPDTPSVLVTVRPGEGLHAVIRRAIPGDDPRTREAATWEWNGGEHTLLAGQVVSVPVFWQPAK